LGVMGDVCDSAGYESAASTIEPKIASKMARVYLLDEIPHASDI